MTLIQEHNPFDLITFDDLEIGDIAIELDDQDPEDVIAWAPEELGDRFAVVTALQVDGMAVLDMATRIRPDVRVVIVDTGRLPDQTLKFIEQVRAHYPDTRWDVLEPNAAEVEAMVGERGADLFRGSVADRMRCCQVRKVRPLTAALRGLDGWFTGLRRDQWASRAAIKKVELDHDHQLRLRPVHPTGERRRERARRALVVGDRRAEGVRHALPDRDRQLRARRRGDHRVAATSRVEVPRSPDRLHCWVNPDTSVATAMPAPRVPSLRDL